MKRVLTTVMFLWSIFAFASLEIVENAGNMCFYKFEVGDYKVIDEGEFSQIVLEEFEDWGDVGAPRLPLEKLDFIVPENGKLTIQIVNYEAKKIKLSKPLIPNVTMVEGKETYQERLIINNGKYNEMRKVLKKGSLSSFRQYDFYSVLFSPVIYDHEKLELTLYTNIDFKITISEPIKQGETWKDSFESVYSAKFQNYRYARNYGIKRETISRTLDFTEADFWYKITVNGDGLYYLQDELAELPGFAVSEQLSIVKSVQNSNNFIWEEQHITYNDLGSTGLDSSDKLYFENFGDGNTLWLRLSNNNMRSRLDISDRSAEKVLAFSKKKFQSIDREDYHSIIIYPDNNTFFTQAQRLADHYLASYQLESLLISQEDIFDTYTGGNETQATGQIAIRDTLEACYNLYSNLQYVTLLGSGTSSWNTNSDKNKIITFGTGYNFVSDDGFVDFNPEDSEYLPELAIGRMPAQNDTQMDRMIDRLEAYFTAPSGLWRDKVLFVADDENKGGGYEGLVYSGFGMNHSKVIQHLSSFLDPEVITEKVFAFNYEFDQFQNKPEVRDKQVEILNDGCAMWFYVGHGNPSKIGDEDYFSVSDMQYLENLDNLTVFVAASCSVGKYDDPNVDCLSEQLLYLPDGGSIASIGATDATAPNFNAYFMEVMTPFVVNDTQSLGMSMLSTKAVLATQPSYSYRVRKYSVLGSPVVRLPYPEVNGNFVAILDSLQARETIDISGTIGSANSMGTALLMVQDSEQELNYTNYDYYNEIGDDEYYYFSVDYTLPGNNLFAGAISVNNGVFDAQIIIPDDISDGNQGKMLLYFYDQVVGEDYMTVLTDVDYSSIPVDVTDNTPPVVKLMIDSEKFQSGDYVSTSPLLIANIEDENGINTLGEPGHSILMLADDQEPIDVSSGFIYEEDSARRGQLTWQLPELEEGNHTVQLIVFDNFNNFQVANTDFVSKSAADIYIKEMLFYPNPYDYEDAAKFTFLITEQAEVKISVYTISGKKIAQLPKQILSAGYNEVAWDGRDNDGDKLANGNYFYKLRVKGDITKKSKEKIGKLIILK